MKYIKPCILIFCFCFALQALALDPWKAPRRGVHFYEDPKPPKKIKKPKKVKVVVQKMDDLEWSKQQREQVERLLSRALRYPTVKNVLAYRLKEKETIERAEEFAYLTQLVNLLHPEVRLLKENPADYTSNQIEMVKDEQAKEASVRRLAKSHGLLFFFSSHCQHCHSFSSVLKAFSKQYGFKVIPLSVEGAGIPEYPNAQDGRAMISRLVNQHGLSMVHFQLPSVFAMNPNRNPVEVFPVSYGNNSMDALIENIFLMEKMFSKGVKSK